VRVIRRPRLGAAAALALLIVGQLVAFKHQADARHVTCAEHGEQLEVATGIVGHDDGCGQSHLSAVDGSGSATHEDCAIARLLRTSARPSHIATLHVTAIELSLDARVETDERPRALDIIALAPKTSPPV
jgi:hypothetical protein